MLNISLLLGIMRKEHLENVGKKFHLYIATDILKLGRELGFSQIESF